MNRNLHIIDKKSVYGSQYINFLKSLDFDCINDYYDLSQGFGFGKYRELRKKISQYDRVFLHGLDHRIVIFLFFHQPLAKKCNWVTWGADVYYFKMRKKTIRHDIFEMMRKRVILKLKEINSLYPELYSLLEKVYKTKAGYRKSFYPVKKFAVDPSEVPENLKTEEKKIMVGNSGDPANNHQQIFEALRHLKGEKIRIYCPLSYGKLDYIEQVEKKGKEIFQEKFVSLRTTLPFEEYVALLTKIDIGIYNHKRAQAMGNIRLLIHLQKKLFIRNDIVTWRFFEEIGVQVYDVDVIKNMSLDELFENPKEIAEKNQQILAEAFSDERCAELWKDILEN